MIGRSTPASELWKSFKWKKFQKILFRLQKRVYKAVRAGDKRKARSLQKLILKSQSAKLLAIRQVTQLNAGKKTAGIDGVASLSFEERLALARELSQHHTNWKHKGLREIPIPKKDGTIRMLKVPTIADRAWQCLAKYALEPAHEATFHARSYGFRTGRSAHNAQKYLFDNLRSMSHGIDKRVIELDIEKCFDMINHTAIMDNLIAPAGLKLGIFRCLKAGTNVGFPDQGTPQGGVVSPLLANIALNGIESLHRYKGTNRNSLWFIRHKAYKIFNKEAKQDRHSVIKLIEKAFPAVPHSENKHIIVKGEKSPYDGDISYWSERKSKLYEGLTSKAKKQSRKCVACGLIFIGEEKVHLHHADGNHDNWDKKNLVAIHESCHDYVHMSNKGKVVAIHEPCQSEPSTSKSAS